jgi:hypothetical protein
MSGTRAISTTWRRELSSSFFSPLQGKAPKEIHAILTETLAYFLPGRAKDLPTLLYFIRIAPTLIILATDSFFQYNKISGFGNVTAVWLRSMFCLGRLALLLKPVKILPDLFKFKIFSLQ